MVEDETVLEAEHELHMKFDGAHVQWCPTQDIVAIISRGETDT